MIEILHVDKRVRTSWILRNAHATLAPGLTVVVGANGSGKSTLLQCRVGQWRPTRGEIRVNGKPANRLGYEAGVLLDPPGFYEHLTAKEMLAYYVRLCGRKWSARHEELLHRFGVPQGRIRGFSRGQRQKLGILCSVWHEPEIWVLDEPFTGLDGYSIELLWTEIARALKTHAQHVVMVLHAPYGFPAMIHQVVRIANQTIDFVGTRQAFARQVLAERGGQISSMWADVLSRHHVPFTKGESPTHILLDLSPDVLTRAAACLLESGFNPLIEER